MSSTNPRVRKIADRIQVIVAEMLERRIKDPRLGFVTVTDVRVTGDTQQATVFYTVLGEEARPATTRPRRWSRPGACSAPRSPSSSACGTRRPSTFVHDALPENARHLDEVLARARAQDEEVAARRGAAYAGDAGPVPQAARAADDEDDDHEDDAGRVSEPPARAGRRRQARRPDLARRRRPGPPARRHPQGRPRRHPRPDGHRRAGGRRRPGHPAARPPDADREGVRRHGPARRHHDHRRRRGRGRRDGAPPAALDEEQVRAASRRSRARSSRCRRRSRRSRSTASARTRGCARARTSSSPPGA